MTTAAVAVAAIRAGDVVVIPTDTVYGLASDPHSEEAVRALYRAKGRADLQPTALVAASVETLLELVPEAPVAVVDALLPGPFTLIVANPAARFPWLCGDDASSIGVRVPALTGVAREVLESVGAVAATSANFPGEPDPKSVDELDPTLGARVAVVVDGGTLPGVASTVVRVTGGEPVVLREGAVGADATLARLEQGLADRS